MLFANESIVGYGKTEESAFVPSNVMRGESEEVATIANWRVETGPADTSRPLAMPEATSEGAVLPLPLPADLVTALTAEATSVSSKACAAPVEPEV